MMLRVIVRKLLNLALAGLILAVFLYSQNNWLRITRITLYPGGLPAEFAGLKIVQVADLHTKEFGPGQAGLLRAIRAEEPDLVVFTGDIIDSQTTDFRPVMDLMEGLAAYPRYYVAGNHELGSGRWSELSRELKARQVQILDRTSQRIEWGAASIRIVGIPDPFVGSDTLQARVERYLGTALRGINRAEYTILLAHRPEHLASYAAAGADLVFSGHAHGGQVIIPWVGGLIAPGQGLFPQYYAGVYPQDKTTLVVSRGLGNSVVKQRLFNRPDLVVVTLETDKPQP